MEKKCNKLDQTWSKTNHLGPNGPDQGQNGPEMDENPSADFIFPEHVSERKWNRNAVRWTRHGPKWTILAKMDHMVQNGPDMGPNGLKNPSLLT